MEIYPGMFGFRPRSKSAEAILICFLLFGLHFCWLRSMKFWLNNHCFVCKITLRIFNSIKHMALDKITSITASASFISSVYNVLKVFKATNIELLLLNFEKRWRKSR